MSKAQITRENILKVAARLFAANGVKATTVRDICKEAGVTHNMVGHHFGGKDALLNEIIAMYARGLFPEALEIIATPIKDRADFAAKYREFQIATLDAAVEHRDIIVVFAENPENEQCPDFPRAMQALLNYQKALREFLGQGVAIGAVRADADVEMIAAAVWDRISIQVRYADKLRALFGDQNVLNPEFRQRWLKANVDAYLYGILSGND